MLVGDIRTAVAPRNLAPLVGLREQLLLGVAFDHDRTQQVEAAVDELDLTIADIRSTIFGLQARSADGARAEITRVVTDARDGLGFLPRVQFHGPLDTTMTPELTEAATAVVREALANVIRHARATRAEVVVAATADELQIAVSDDGIGIRRSASPSGHGLRNLAARAEQLMGAFEVRSEPGEGTTVTWRIPL